MTILEGGSDQELMRLWGLIAELSEELNQNRSLAVSLYSQATNVKNQAIHSQTGFVLRRFNLDKSREAFEAELERMNTVISAENHGLQHDNKQLNTLIKEYEQTLETLMSAFRTRARDVQDHELSLIRDYEAKLLVQEEEDATQDLATSTAVSRSLARLSHSLRQLMRSLAGEDHSPEPLEDADDPEARNAEWALNRECELARLEEENEALRRMLELPVESSGHHEGGQVRMVQAGPSFSTIPDNARQSRLLGGQHGTVGPFGMYKRMRSAG